MDIQCRPMTVSDYGVIETEHWVSVDQVKEYIERQGIASMLAFAGNSTLVNCTCRSTTLSSASLEAGLVIDPGQTSK